MGQGFSRVAWAGVVAAIFALGIAGPVQMVRARRTSEAPSRGASVRMAGLAFVPAQLSVAPGTVVVFRNQDVAPHTVTSGANGIESGTIAPSKSFRLVVNHTIDYVCSIHPGMQGRIVVTG